MTRSNKKILVTKIVVIPYAKKEVSFVLPLSKRIKDLKGLDIFRKKCERFFNDIYANPTVALHYKEIKMGALDFEKLETQ